MINHFKEIKPGEEITGYVKTILVFENDKENTNTILPFFADGYPGLIYHTASDRMYLNPAGKKMTDLFLYGQTLHPIQLAITGKYRLIIFQLFPYTLTRLFNLNSKELNDDCFDLASNDISSLLKASITLTRQIEIITTFISQLIKEAGGKSNNNVRQAIQLILESNGTIPIKDLRNILYISERTLQRQFIAETGISPKKFAKIIQFQASLNQLTQTDYSRLTDIAYDKGFADQSHFTRTIKKYTGKTPISFQDKS